MFSQLSSQFRQWLGGRPEHYAPCSQTEHRMQKMWSYGVKKRLPLNYNLQFVIRLPSPERFAAGGHRKAAYFGTGDHQGTA